VGSNSNITENGMAVEPQTHQLFAVVNERDEIGPDLVPDYLTSIRQGGFYGWPYSYWGNHVDVRVHPERSDLVAQAIKPDYGLSSHVAPLSLLFSEGQQLNGRPVGKPISVVTGFLGKDNETVRGRPLGLALDRSGSLLVAGDVGNTVWRVSATQPGI
jgi:glucose/arabinose dehydrogenase